jgi:hypothetical protein
MSDGYLSYLPFSINPSKFPFFADKQKTAAGGRTTTLLSHQPSNQNHSQSPISLSLPSPPLLLIYLLR